MSNETPAFAPFMPTNETPTLPMPAANEPPKRGRKNRKVAQPEAPKATRKPRTPKPNKPLPKYDLQTILKVAGTLKEGDQKAFEGLLGELATLPTASRERVLAALQQVFG